jgi:hypothetical protein
VAPRSAPACAGRTSASRSAAQPAGGETFQRATGEGYVAAHDGLYADALAKGLPVLLCVMETSGAVGTTLAGVVRLLARTATATAHGRHDRRHPLHQFTTVSVALPLKSSINIL